LSVDDSKFTHIVGMYKCGTSWLSHIMAAHPAIISWREFDIIRATHTELPPSHSYRLADRLASLLRLPAPKTLGSEFVCKSKEEIIQEIFGGQGWVPLMGEEARAKASALDYSDSGKFIDQLMELGDKTLRRDKGPLLKPERFSNTLGLVNTRRRDLIPLLDAIKNSEDMSQVPHYFLEYLQRQCEPGTPIVLKAADQIVSLRLLQQYSPHSTKIAIIRDGRDAAISAMHFRKLMKKWDAPWTPKNRDYLGVLGGWATRTRVLANWAKQSDIIILRYEDLQRDFFGICGKLFERMGIPTSREVLEHIYQNTNFTAVTGGRQPGESAEHLVRKGVIGEWKTALDEEDADMAWKIAGRELKRFGYTQDGEYREGIANLLSAG